MTTTEQEAGELAHKVASYWSTRGYAPQIWTIPEMVTASPTSHRLSWTVRSNMIGGWPKGAPCSSSNFNSATQSESLAGISGSPGIRQSEIRNESVRPSQRPWHGEAIHG